MPRAIVAAADDRAVAHDDRCRWQKAFCEQTPRLLEAQPHDVTVVGHGGPAAMTLRQTSSTSGSSSHIG
jgi:hypothetical protein